MSIDERQGMSGRLTLELRHPDGSLLERRRVDNLITRAGRMLVARLFSGELAGPPALAIAVGSGSTPASVSDAALEAQLDQAAADPAPVQESEDEGAGGIASVSVTLPTLPPGASQALREAGILITLPGAPPVLYNRVTFPTITRTENLQMTLTWEVTF